MRSVMRSNCPGAVPWPPHSPISVRLAAAAPAGSAAAARTVARIVIALVLGTDPPLSLRLDGRAGRGARLTVTTEPAHRDGRAIAGKDVGDDEYPPARGNVEQLLAVVERAHDHLVAHRALDRGPRHAQLRLRANRAHAAWGGGP